jgi:aspartate racemase
MTAKKIGILGGISPESTIAYYDHIIKQYYTRFKDCYYPEIVIYSLDFQRFTDFENSGDTLGYIDEILKGITSLQKARVDFIIMAANSPHAVFDEIERFAIVPLLSIVEVTADYAQRQGLKRLLLTGIKFTMQSNFYPVVCQQRDIQVITPTPEEQDEIDRIIFEELAIGLFKAESKHKLLSIINNYQVDGVILGCTELPLILKPQDAAIPLLNTLELHAEAALDYALASD